ncbi:lethal giant larvae like, C-terminal-domain-containing protein [Limtongia smithiae]|uniref:lethal giant larvae like, C-terminal-domain-containing protein n=1 Tax=Limtongia smithiae TaxID=1125753 RepID=UPI0034CE07CD
MLKLKGFNKDLSAGLTSSVFDLNEIGHFGIRGGVEVIAFDPVQSLLAAGTTEGYLYVFGQPGVQVAFDLCPGKRIKFLRIVKSIYLVAVDSSDNVSVISLDTRDVLSVFTASAKITCIESDPSLDWLFIGMENGLIIGYDVDRGGKTPYRISNLQKVAIPRAPLSPVKFISIHPLSYHILLIGYDNCAVVYSIADDDMLLVLQFEIPAGAPGGELNPIMQNRSRIPRLMTGLWHPTGNHIVTSYDDGSIVFWDAKEGVLLQARTIEDTDVNIPRRSAYGASQPSPLSQTGPGRLVHVRREPVYKMAWCCGQNPSDSALVVAGGESSEVPLKGITFMDFGSTPVVQITSYQVMGQFYAQPRRQRIYPVPPGAEPVDFIMVPRSSPFYNGCQDPVALVAILSSGELYSIEYPSGAALPVAAMFPPSLCWIQPRITRVCVAQVRREQWIGMMASKKQDVPPMLTGGAPGHNRLRGYDMRNIVVTGHSDGWVRLWDASHGEIEESQILDLSIADALDRSVNVRVNEISFSGAMGEMSIASDAGEVVFFKFGLNRPVSSAELQRRVDALNISTPDGKPPLIQQISARIDPKMKEGFLPMFVLNPAHGPVTALKNTDIGFLAVGYQFGSVAVVDLRTQTLIFLQNLSDLGDESSGKPFSSLRRNEKSNAANQAPIEFATCIEASLMAIEGDSYSSIILSVGTSAGRLVTLRILPTKGGSHAVQYVATSNVKGRVFSIIPFDYEFGVSAVASQNVLSRLPQGIVIHGAIIAVSADEARIIRMPNNRAGSKSFDTAKAIAAGLSYLRQGDTLVLVIVMTGGLIKVYSLPGLRELATLSAAKYFDPRFTASSTVVCMNGDVLFGAGKNESVMFNIFGTANVGRSLWTRGNSTSSEDKVALYDVMKRMPPRPAISTIKWMAGTRYVSPEDFDLLIGGPHRPKSKRTIEQERAAREQQRLLATQKIYSEHNPPPSSRNSIFFKRSSSIATSGSGNSDYLNDNSNASSSRDLHEEDEYGRDRGERKGFMEDSFAKFDEMSNSLSSFLDDPRKSMATSYFKSKFF